MKMHERPLSEWKLAISINAVVSILTTIAKSALMLLVAESISHLKWCHYKSTQSVKDVQAFDAASRGPWGAMVFALGIRGRAFLSTLASVIVVVSLGFEPAAQQMLSFPSRSVVTEDSTRIHVYQALSLNTTNLVFLSPSSGEADPSNSLQVALINSFAGNVNDAQYRCPTSTCRFGDFETLGVCEQCRDATPLVHHIRNFTGGGGGLDANGESSYKSYKDYIISLNPYYPTIVFGFSNHGGQSGNQRFVISGNYNYDSEYRGNRRAGFMAVNMSDLLDNTLESTRICDFQWCTRTYSAARVTNGQFHYEKESRSFLDITNSTPDGVYSVDTTFTLGRSQPGQTKQYKVDHMVEKTLWSYVNKTISGDSNSNSVVQMMSGQPFDSTAELISLAITNWMRSTENNGSVLLPGEALESLTFVHVKWPWLVWPATLTIVGSIILLLCILQGQRQDTLFKSSALALLFHGLYGFNETDLKISRHRGGREDNGTLEETARGLRAKFEPDEDGVLKFVKQ
jgi:Protein of unknown function (DUF3176)